MDASDKEKQPATASRPELGSAPAALELIARVSFTVIDRAPVFLRMYEAAHHIREAFAADGCVIRELTGDALHLIACSGMSEAQLPAVMSARAGLAQQVLSTRKPVAVFDVPNNPDTALLHSAAAGKWFQFCSYAGVPMLVSGKALGILGIYSCDPVRRFSDQDLYHLQIVASQLAVSLQNSRLFRQVQEQRDRLEKQLEEQRQIEIELTCRLEHSEAQRLREQNSGTASDS